MHATREEMAPLRKALYPLTRKLAVRLARKRRHGRKGPLDFRNTVRHSLSYGGVPAEPKFRYPRPPSPRSSSSPTSPARWPPSPASRCTSSTPSPASSRRCASFVFIDGIDEVTRFFEGVEDIAEAVHRVNTEADVVWVDGHSDYGHAFEVFWERWGKEIGPKTTVIILGDARNNYHASPDVGAQGDARAPGPPRVLAQPRAPQLLGHRRLDRGRVRHPLRRRLRVPQPPPARALRRPPGLAAALLGHGESASGRLDVAVGTRRCRARSCSVERRRDARRDRRPGRRLRTVRWRVARDRRCRHARRSSATVVRRLVAVADRARRAMVRSIRRVGAVPRRCRCRRRALGGGPVESAIGSRASDVRREVRQPPGAVRRRDAGADPSSVAARPARTWERARACQPPVRCSRPDSIRRGTARPQRRSSTRPAPCVGRRRSTVAADRPSTSAVPRPSSRRRLGYRGAAGASLAHGERRRARLVDGGARAARRCTSGPLRAAGRCAGDAAWATARPWPSATIVAAGRTARRRAGPLVGRTTRSGARRPRSGRRRRRRPCVHAAVVDQRRRRRPWRTAGAAAAWLDERRSCATGRSGRPSAVHARAASARSPRRARSCAARPCCGRTPISSVMPHDRQLGTGRLARPRPAAGRCSCRHRPRTATAAGDAGAGRSSRWSADRTAPRPSWRSVSDDHARPGSGSLVQAALRLGAAGPAARAGVVGIGGQRRARLAADRRVALAQQRVDRHVVGRRCSRRRRRRSRWRSG